VRQGEQTNRIRDMVSLLLRITANPQLS